MSKGIVFTIVAIALVGLLLVLSVDDDPPEDAHLVAHQNEFPVESNGYTALVQALELLDWPEEDDWMTDTPWRELSRDEVVRDLVASNREALSLVEEAVAAPRFEVPVSLDVEPPSFVTGTNRLARLAALDAALRTGEGESVVVALDPLLQHLALANRFKQTGGLIYYAIGDSQVDISLRRVVSFAAESDDGSGLASVIDRLGDFAWERDAMEGTLAREYALMSDAMDDLYDQYEWSNVPLVASYFYQPNRTRKLFADSYTAVIGTLEVDCAAASRVAPEAEFPKWRYVAPNSVGRILHSIGLIDLDKFTYKRCIEQMRLNLSRLALGIYAYRADTGGLPVRLDELVPTYLSEIPADVDGKPFRYSSSDASLYSVGGDRRDGGGGGLTGEIDWKLPDPGVSFERP